MLHLLSLCLFCSSVPIRPKHQICTTLAWRPWRSCFPCSTLAGDLCTTCVTSLVMWHQSPPAGTTTRRTSHSSFCSRPLTKTQSSGTPPPGGQITFMANGRHITKAPPGGQLPPWQTSVTQLKRRQVDRLPAWQTSVIQLNRRQVDRLPAWQTSVTQLMPARWTDYQHGKRASHN